MKPYFLLPVVSAAGGFAAFLVRLAQNRTGFDSATGLPVPGAPAALILPLLLCGLCLLLAVLCLTLPRSGASPFSTDNRLFLTLPVMGSLLFTLSGAADLAEALFPDSGFHTSSHVSTNLLGAGSVDMSQGVLFLCGALSLAASFGLLTACAACVRDGSAYPGEALLIAPISLVVRLVAVYRVESVNPVLEDYAPELLALTFLVLGFYTLSAFPYNAGETRRFAFFSGCGAAFALCALADRPEHLSTPLLCAGGSLCLLGFLALEIQSLEKQAAQ